LGKCLKLIKNDNKKDDIKNILGRVEENEPVDRESGKDKDKKKVRKENKKAKTLIMKYCKTEYKIIERKQKIKKKCWEH